MADIKNLDIETKKDFISDETPLAINENQFSYFIEKQKPKDLNQLRVIQSIDNNDNDPRSNVYEIRYVDEQGEKKLCRVKGKQNIESYLTDYIRRYFGDLKSEITTTVEVNISAEAVKVEIKKELENLEKDTLHTYIDEIKTNLEKIKETYKGTQEKLKAADITILKKRGRLTQIEELFVKALRNKVDQDINDIAQDVQRLKFKDKDVRKERTNSDIITDLDNINRNLLKYKNNQNHIESYYNSPSAFSSFMENAPTDFERSPRGDKESEKLKDYFTCIEKAKEAVNKDLIQADLRKIMSDHGENLYDWLNRVASGEIDPAVEPFKLSPNHVVGFDEIAETEPSLQNFVYHPYKLEDTRAKKEKKKREKKEKNETSTNAVALPVNPESIYANGANNGGLLDKLTPSQLTGLIDKQNWSPEVKSRVKTIGGLALLGGIAYLGRKTLHGAYKTIFTKEATTEDKAFFGGGALLFGTLFATTGSIFDVKEFSKKVGNILGSTSENKDATETEKMVYGRNHTHVLFKGMTYNSMRQFVDFKDNGKPKLNYGKMELFLKEEKKSGSKLDSIDARLAVLKKLEGDDGMELFALAMQGLGLTKETLEKPENAEKIYDGAASEVIIRVGALADYMTTNHYVSQNHELDEQIQDYLTDKDGAPSLAKLEKMGAFEKEIPADKKLLKKQIDALTSITDIAIKKNLLTQAIKVEDEITSKNSYAGTFEISEKGGKVYLKTYGRETQIDAADKKIVYGNTHLKMHSTYQMLKAANLTNRIQSLFEKKASKAYAEKNGPFNLSIAGGDIEFEANNKLKRSNLLSPIQTIKDVVDTEAISGGKRGSLENIAPSLEDQKAEYVRFLNLMPIRKK